MSRQASDIDMDERWCAWIIHDGTARPSTVRLGDLIEVHFFEVGFSGLRWHRDVFVVGERELGMSWADWRIWSILAYRVQHPKASATKALCALHEIVRAPMPTRRPTATYLVEHLGAPKRDSDHLLQLG